MGGTRQGVSKLDSRHDLFMR